MAHFRSELAEQIYAALDPFTRVKPLQQLALINFIDAWATPFLGEIYDLVRDRDEGPGWSILFDPDRAPSNALPYLAQFVGVELSNNMTDLERREAIKNPSGWRRGTPEALVDAVARTLTDTRKVIVIERHEGSAYKLWVRTLVVETPDEDATVAAILSQKPLGIVLTYQSITGLSWFDVDSENADWATVNATYDDLEEMVFTTPAA